MEFRSTGFEITLRGKNKCPYTGKETAINLSDGIKLYRDEYGSNRFVLYINRRAVSALQIMAHKDRVYVANVITVAQHRRKGYAKQLWNEAKKIYPVIHHSENLSPEGKIFADKCK